LPQTSNIVSSAQRFLDQIRSLLAATIALFKILEELRMDHYLADQIVTGTTAQKPNFFCAGFGNFARRVP
jgi:hypothetical protein